MAAALAVLVAGWLIGATGIGGVLVVPLLAGLQGLPPSQAVAASALAFAFPGVAALLWLRRAPADPDAPPSRLSMLVLGAIPGAVAGAIAVHRLPTQWLLAGLAALAITSGLRGLRRPQAGTTPVRRLGAAAAAALGFAVGLGSALTGTGGPVLLIPLMMLLGQPLRSTVAAAQVIQLPLALAASVGHWQAGRLELSLALTLGLLLMAGSLIGHWAGRRIDVRQLQRGVSLLLVATGLWLGGLALRFLMP